MKIHPGSDLREGALAPARSRSRPPRPQRRRREGRVTAAARRLPQPRGGSHARGVFETASLPFNNPAVEHDDAAPHRTARVRVASAREARHTLPLKLPQITQIQPVHTSPVKVRPLVCPPPPGSVRRNYSAPSFIALHTLFRRHAPTNPLCSAMRAHSSGRRRPDEWQTSRRRPRVCRLGWW
jgi:hypothetical protein